MPANQQQQRKPGGVFQQLIQAVRDRIGDVGEGISEGLQDFFGGETYIFDKDGKSARFPTRKRDQFVNPDGSLKDFGGQPDPQSLQAAGAPPEVMGRASGGMPTDEFTGAAGPSEQDLAAAGAPTAGNNAQKTREGMQNEKVKAAGFKDPEQVAQAVRRFYESHLPADAKGVNQYYPIGEMLDDMVVKAEKQRPGLGALLGLQAFFESTGGRSGNNLFGTKPGGNVSQFASLEDAIDYQLSENVLGGGANPNMNVLNEEHKGAPLTVQRVRRLYDSYDPPGAYLDALLDAFTMMRAVEDEE